MLRSTTLLGAFLLTALFVVCSAPDVVFAERLFTSGCELQVPGGSAAMSGVEFAFGGTTPTVETGLKRSGAVSCRTTAASASSVFRHRFAGATTQGPYFARFYVYIPSGSVPNNDAALATYVDGVASNARSVLVLKSNRTLALLNDALSQVATYTAQPLATNTWHRIEYRYGHGTGGVQVRLNGTEVMRVNGEAVSVNQIELGLYNSLVSGYNSGTGSLYFDDIAINDGVGDIQNSFPGSGSVVHLRPNAAGEVSNCLSGSWLDIDETTPATTVPDICTFNVNTTQKTIDVHVESLPIAVAALSPHITVVHGGVHLGASAAGATHFGQVYLKSAAGGSMAVGTTTYGTVPYYTNTAIQPRNYTLTSYANPATNCHWAASGTNSLDSLLVGFTAESGDVYLNTVWATVEYSTDPTFREPCATAQTGNLFDPIWTAVNGLSTDLQTKGVGFWAPAIATDQLCFGSTSNCVSSWNRQARCRLETYRVAARPNAVSFPAWNLPDFSTDITTGLCDDMLSASSKTSGWVSTGFDYANRVVGGVSVSPRACYFMRLVCDTDIQMLQGTASAPEVYPVADFTTSTFKCSNLIDDDGDGAIDYPEDPGCDAWSDIIETDGLGNCPIAC